MDTAQIAGEPEPILLAGEEFPVRLLTLGEWAPLTGWIKRNSPSPVTRAALAIQQAADDGLPLDAATEAKLMDHAQMQALSWPPRLGSKAWFEALNNCDGGQAQFLLTVLRVTVPDFSQARAEALAPRLSSADWDELLRACFYGLPPAPAKKKAGDASSAGRGPSAFADFDAGDDWGPEIYAALKLLGVMPWDFHRLTPKLLRIIQHGGKDPLLEQLRDKAKSLRALTMARLMTLSMQAANGQTG